jgi:hypothetical protein
MRREEGWRGNVVLVGGEPVHVTVVMWWWLTSVVVGFIVVGVGVVVVVAVVVVVVVVAAHVPQRWVDQHAKRMAAGLRPGQP